MPLPEVILFDVFGTLVTYQDDHTLLRYPATHELAVSSGFDGDHDAFLDEWDVVYRVLEAESAATLVEHAGHQVVAGFCDRTGLGLADDQREALLASYLGEWCAPIVPVDGVVETMEHLAEQARIGVVSNTHNASLVPAMLRLAGVDHLVEHVVTSIDHGYRKPHPSIYQAALAPFDCAPADAIFVGDSYEADYLGPIDAGMTAYLIDPDRRHDVPAEARLDTVLDLRKWLSSP